MALANEAEIAELTERVNREFRELGRVTPETAKALMEAETQISNFNFKVEVGTKVLDKLASAAINTQKAMYRGEKGAAAFNQSIGDMADAAQIAAVGLSLLIPGGPLMKAAVAGITYLATSAMKAGSELIQTANKQSDTLYDTFQKLSKSGAAGSDGMTGVFGDIQKLGLGIQDLDGYISLINDSSRDLARFGGSVTAGVKAFADMNDEMKPFTEQLYNAGLNQEDIAKGAMSYLKIQTQLGASQTMTSKQLADGAKKYLIEQDALTKLTGMSRADAEAAREAAMSEQRFAAKIAAMKRSGDPKQIAAAEELIKANSILESQSKEAAQGFRDLSTGMITTEASQKALVSSNGEALTQATEIASGNATAVQGVEKMGKAFGKFAEDMNATAQAGVFEDFGIKFSDAVKLGIFASKNLEAEYEKINKDLVDQGVTGQKAKDDLQQTQTEIRLVQKEAMLATQSFIQDIVPGATKAMLALAKAANDAAQALGRSQTPSAKEAGKLSGTEADIYTGGAMSEEARGGEVKYPSTPAGTKPTAATVPLNAQGKPMSIMEQAQASSEAAKANNAQRQAAPAKPAPAAPAPAAPAPAKPAPAAPAGGGGAPAPSGGGGAPAPSGGGGGGGKEPSKSTPPPDAGNKKGAGGDVNMDDVRKRIIAHEGNYPYPYKDIKGLWTIGVGHLIGDGSKLPPEFDAWKNNGPAIGAGSKGNNTNPAWTQEQVMAQLDKDISGSKAGAERNTKNYADMASAGKAAFIDLAFNMGGNWIKAKGFKGMERALEAKNNAGIVESLTNSLWYKQVGDRGKEVIGLAGQAFAAEGGVFDGPKSGYAATLHGNEAVIPLKDGAVPVSMSQEFNMTAANLGELVAIMKNNVGMQDRMLAVLDDIRRSQSTMTDNTGKMVAMAA